MMFLEQKRHLSGDLSVVGEAYGNLLTEVAGWNEYVASMAGRDVVSP